MRFDGTTDDEFYEKAIHSGTTLVRVTVDGHDGYWISGDPHFFFYQKDGGYVDDGDGGSAMRSCGRTVRPRTHRERVGARSDDRHRRVDRVGRALSAFSGFPENVRVDSRTAPLPEAHP
jgi:hypothetical protein